MRRSRLPISCLSLLALATFSIRAEASKPRLHLERIDATALGESQLKLYVSAMELEGSVVDGVNPGQFTLLVDGKAAGRPTKLQDFAATNEEVDAAFVVEVGAQYKKDLEALKGALKDFLEDPPRKMRGMLIPYGSDFETGHGFVPIAALENDIDDLATDDDSVDLRMVDAVGAALTALKRLEGKDDGKPTPRRVIVLISDGLNGKMDRPTFRALGDRAAKAGVPIHCIAFTPSDERGPLLNLGELSKRSNGTFRWANKSADLKTQLSNLGEELKKQYVLTFKSPVPSLDQHNFALRMDDVVSNSLGTGTVVAGKSGGGKSTGWGMIIAIVLGLLVALGGVVVFIQWRASIPPKIKQKIVPGQKIVAKAGPSAERPAVASKPAVAPKPAAAAAGGAATGAATLVWVGGALAGTRTQVRGVMTLGKTPGQTITVSDDPAVSGRHAEIGSDPKGSYVKDLGSTNGTFINGQRITGLQRLRDGDIVRFGATTQFKVRID